MTKHLEAVIHGFRQSLQIAPRRPYIDPKGQSTTSDAGRIRGDAQVIVRNADRVFRANGQQIKNCKP